MAKEHTWIESIKIVLASSKVAMHYKDIADEIVKRGLRQNVSATPAALVATTLSTSITKDGDASPFQKVGRGEYMLRATVGKHTAILDDQVVELVGEEDEPEEQYAIVTSFGMYWRRDLVNWTAHPSVLGMQQIGAEPVDFQKQVGIYLLYDGREVIYVGRSKERPIGQRLYEHTLDRMSTRWDRFSWFGLLPVMSNGHLGQLPDGYAADTIIPALEGILIEALEPRQNRKRGDDLAAVEYLQKEDPLVERKKKQAILKAAMDNA